MRPYFYPDVIAQLEREKNLNWSALSERFLVADDVAKDAYDMYAEKMARRMQAQPRGERMHWVHKLDWAKELLLALVEPRVYVELEALVPKAIARVYMEAPGAKTEAPSSRRSRTRPRPKRQASPGPG